MNYDSTFDIDMDGEITNEEFILGMTWMNEYLALNPSGEPYLVFEASDDDLESYLDSAEVLGLEQWLKFKSYVSNWNLMIADQTPESDEVDAARLVEFKYRNFNDFSIWEYTDEMFTALDINADDSIDFDEYLKFHAKQFRFYEEIYLSFLPNAYYLLTVDDDMVEYLEPIEREFLDINLDGFIDW